MLKCAFTALYNECCHLDFFSVCQTVLSISSPIRRVRRCQQYFLSLYIALPSCSRHHRQHVVALHILRSSRPICRVDDCRPRGSHETICTLLHWRCDHRIQNTKRGVRCRVLFPVSLFLVCNDVLFFLAFNYISFYFCCFLAVITVAYGKA